MNISAAEIAERVGGILVGDGEVQVTGVNGIRQAGEGDLSFYASVAYERYLKSTKAAILLVPTDFPAGSMPTIQVADPYKAFLTIVQIAQPEATHHPEGIHPTAVVADTARLGENVALGPHVVIGDACEIGDNVILHAGVVIAYGCTIGASTTMFPNVSILEGTQVGARCILHSGAVLGSDGFGFSPGPTGLQKIPQVGTVAIGDDVEIGANSAVDRATFGETRIGSGTKIDNLVQIGHNNELGQHCVVCGNVGIAGSTVLGNGVTVAGAATINGHIEIGDGVTVGGLSGVTKSVKPGQVVSGFPAIKHSQHRRVQAGMQGLPKTLRTIRDLKRRIEELEDQLHGKAENDS
jgi:UDP-3-O-[3-hydroxymyristoyl] glucosamine N-acyltransferase